MKDAQAVMSLAAHRPRRGEAAGQKLLEREAAGQGPKAWEGGQAPEHKNRVPRGSRFDRKRKEPQARSFWKERPQARGLRPGRGDRHPNTKIAYRAVRALTGKGRSRRPEASGKRGRRPGAFGMRGRRLEALQRRAAGQEPRTEKAAG